MLVERGGVFGTRDEGGGEGGTLYVCLRLDILKLNAQSNKEKFVLKEFM
jgi:hypothetical protein